MAAPRLVLASASPRRRSLLTAAGFEFSVEPSDVEERAPRGLEPEEVAIAIARAKALAVAHRHAGTERLVLGADTIVVVDGPKGPRLLGKPADAGEARAMLRALSGSRHRVVTGVCVVRASDGAQAADRERTWVHMRAISPAEIEAYVDSGEWRDKAGGYAIQESADAFVTRLEEGGFDNVVGLPVALARRLLSELERRPPVG